MLSSLLIAFLGYSLSINIVLRSALVWLMTLILVFAFLTYRFYRDPERAVPKRDDIIVSPADGKVIYIREAHNGMLPVSTKHGHEYRLQEMTKTPCDNQQAVVFGLILNFRYVHVNRAPVSSRI